MSREAVQAVLAVVTVLGLALGGPAVLEHVRRPAQRPAAATTSVVPHGQRRVTLELTGMSCAKCAASVSARMLATAGVRACDVDARAGRAIVLCDQAVADTALVMALRRGGARFEATVVER